MVLLLNPELFSQSIVWEYEVETPYRNTPRFFWVDHDGNGFYNMNREDPEYPSRNYTHFFLLSLDANGKFAGANHVKDCASPTDLLPFGDKFFVSSGNNCLGQFRNSRDTRIFNKEGELIKTGKAFDGTYHAKVKGKDGYTFFSDKLGFEDFETMTIGHIDWDFNFSSNTIPMHSLKIDTLGIVNNFRDPAQFDTGSWAIPFNYGKVKNNNQISIQHGIVVGVKEDEIKWTYPSSINSFTLEELSSHKNRLAVVMKSKKLKTTLFTLLDSNGNVLTEIPIKVSSIKDVILTDDELLVLGRHSISKFKLNGELVLSSINYHNNKTVEQTKMSLLANGDIIVTGIRDNNTVIRRIRFEEESEEELIEEETINELEEEEIEIEVLEEEETDNSPIESMILEDVAEDALSVSVYPNPASLFINFDIETDQQSEFMIQIIDANGRVIYTDRFNDTRYELLLSDFTAGTYFYKIVRNTTKVTEVLSGKFVRVN